MKRLQKRPRPDRLENDLITGRRTLGRYFYFFVLTVFMGSLFHFFFGEYYYFDAKGVVNRERSVIDAPYSTLITKTEILPGQYVKQGDRLFDFMVIKDRNNVNPVELSDFAAHGLIIDTNPMVSIKNIPVAVPCAQNQNLICPPGSSGASVGESAETLMPAGGTAQYGFATALRDGFVGENFPNARQIFLPGETIADIFHAKTYVYAYVPINYRWGIKIGDRFKVIYGGQKFYAKATEFLPIALVPPAEFHNSIKAPGRHQIIVLEFESDQPIPVLQEVLIKRNHSIFR